jgi:hypothetical protein
MSDEYPVVVAEVSPCTSKTRNTKKYVIIAVSGILAVAIILTAILVGMYMFTEGQKEIIKYTLKMGENQKQDVTSDPNENVVQFHMSNPAQEAWIVNDFGKDLQVVKIKGEGKTNCYVSPLNRTNQLDPAKINGPESPDVKEAVSLTYRASDTPISDTSFLGKTAKELCKGVSIYWLYPHCIDKDSGKGHNVTEVNHPKSKRQTTVDYSPYYIKTYLKYQSPYDRADYYVPCFTGCCRKVCACAIYYSAYLSNGRMYCTWITSTCLAVNPVWDSCTTGPKGITCPNRSPASTPTC